MWEFTTAPNILWIQRKGEVDVFGSTVLDNKFKDIPLGYEVKIVYQGEKPSTPPKKPFKLFQVFKRPNIIGFH